MEKKNEVFGKRLKILRDRTGLNQDSIAKEVGISRSRYSHYETNRVEPDLDLIRKLSDYHNVTTDYLLGKTDEPHVTEDDKKSSIIERIKTEFPDADLMFNDLASFTADDMQDVYDFIKFKKSQKKD